MNGTYGKSGELATAIAECEACLRRRRPLRTPRQRARGSDGIVDYDCEGMIVKGYETLSSCSRVHVDKHFYFQQVSIEHAK